MTESFSGGLWVFEPEELTPKIKSPTLIIHGLEDALVSPESWL